MKRMVDSFSGQKSCWPVAVECAVRHDYTMKIETIASGNGVAPQRGDTVTVHYTGWLPDGTKFDSSVDRDEPFTFVLGAGQVIEGWDQGVATMRVGDKAR